MVPWRGYFGGNAAMILISVMFIYITWGGRCQRHGFWTPLFKNLNLLVSDGVYEGGGGIFFNKHGPQGFCGRWSVSHILKGSLNFGGCKESASVMYLTAKFKVLGNLQISKIHKCFLLREQR